MHNVYKILNATPKTRHTRHGIAFFNIVVVGFLFNTPLLSPDIQSFSLQTFRPIYIFFLFILSFIQQKAYGKLFVKHMITEFVNGWEWKSAKDWERERERNNWEVEKEKHTIERIADELFWNEQKLLLWIQNHLCKNLKTLPFLSVPSTVRVVISFIPKTMTKMFSKESKKYWMSSKLEILFETKCQNNLFSVPFSSVYLSSSFM